MITRRSVIVALLATPVIIRTPGLLMPIKKLDLRPRILRIVWRDQNDVRYIDERRIIYPDDPEFAATIANHNRSIRLSGRLSTVMLPET